MFFEMLKCFVVHNMHRISATGLWCTIFVKFKRTVTYLVVRFFYFYGQHHECGPDARAKGKHISFN